MTDAEWLSVVEETAAELDEIRFAGSANEAQARLRALGRGRGRAIVLQAMRLRQGLVPHRPPSELLSDVMRWERRVADLEAQLTEARATLEAHRMR